MCFRTLAVALFLATSLRAQDSASGVLGKWREPGGSVIEVYKCGADVCAKMVFLSQEAASQVDSNNPEASARTRPLCGLQIGYGFKLGDASHAESGKLYDPKSGKTYRGSMTAQGEQLNLRGYIGIKAFGRSEIWTRADGGSATCAKS